MSKFERPRTESEIDTMIQVILFYKNPYDILYSSPSDKIETIRSRYRKLAFWFHPDHCKHKDTTEVITVLKKALETIESPESRQPYIEVYNEALEQTKNKWKDEGKHVVLFFLSFVSHFTFSSLTYFYFLFFIFLKPEGDETDEEFDYAVRRATHTLIITLEDRMRKASAIARSNMEYQEEQRKEKREEYKRLEEQQKLWDEGRDQRISDWKSFSSTKRKPGSLKKPIVKKTRGAIKLSKEKK